jgi:hypothetical protein
VSQSSEFCRRSPFCCFSTSNTKRKRIFRYRYSTATFGYTLVFNTVEKMEQCAILRTNSILCKVLHAMLLTMESLYAMLLIHNSQLSVTRQQVVPQHNNPFLPSGSYDFHVPNKTHCYSNMPPPPTLWFNDSDNATNRKYHRLRVHFPSQRVSELNTAEITAMGI